MARGEKSGDCSGQKPRVSYSRRLADRICKELASGRTLRSVCRDENMPTETAVRLWAIDDRDGFAARYEQARALGADAIGDELVDLVLDAPTKGTSGDAAMLRARVDAGSKLLAIMAPKRWGAILSARSNKDAGAPLVPTGGVMIQFVTPSGAAPPELLAARVIEGEAVDVTDGDEDASE